MPPIPKIYTAVNTETGERVSGTAKELGEIFGCVKTHINRCELDGNMVQGKWKICKQTKEGKKCH